MFDQNPQKSKLILATGSPRRQQFFRDLNIEFEIRLKETNEIYPETLKGIEITNYLAELKAAAFEGELIQNEVIITSDTIVWHENTALGKPTDYEDAFRILKSLSNKTHQVITSVCFKTLEKTETISEITQVTFEALSDADIKYYIENYHPFDKAGSYGIQEWIGLIGVAKIEGSYTNVMGLPVNKVVAYLSKNFTL